MDGKSVTRIFRTISFPSKFRTDVYVFSFHFPEEEDPPSHSSSAEATSCQRDGGIHHREGCQGKISPPPAPTTTCARSAPPFAAPNAPTAWHRTRRLRCQGTRHRHRPSAAATSSSRFSQSRHSTHARDPWWQSRVLGQEWPTAAEPSSSKQVWRVRVKMGVLKE